MLALAGCSAASPGIAEAGGVTIGCALNGAAAFSEECRLVELVEGRDTSFVILHPDGGFRRLDLAETPSGFVSRDGASEAVSEFVGDYVVMTIENDRYRWIEPQGG
ncbi:hypothetical protein [Qipengyuania marisflavi]|uniref:Uncharacterized protein n=1 Tax=Qipengyuania marisflavi TaxID=2486356 RepID=A0A5S3P963_9SPHN|nr:hypothetical protein [Qipengyuania marisflavi]TMM50034.1 hypothetical protein FEV51_02225 [Qipengyuania marisflavi]